MNKVKRERNILELASSLLSELYGNFDVVADQLDSPAAAIILKPSNTQVGVEITSVDKRKALEYLNNEKIAKKAQTQQLKDLLTDDSYSPRPTKKVSIPFPEDYIFENVIKKTKKYHAYLESGDYEEMILLVCSKYLSINHESFNDYLKPWTTFLLGEQNFPFDKVIFVCEKSQKSVVVYDKSSPLLKAPKRYSEKESGITTMQGPILPFGQTVNILGMFDEEPHVSTKKKSKKEKKAEKLVK